MSYPKYTDAVRISSQSSARPPGRICRRIWHHQASTNDNAVIDMMVNRTRQVSANQTVDNKPPRDQPWRRHARITTVVETERRAWTSSSAAADGLAMTAEVCNSTGAPDWGISESTYLACAIIAADDYLNLGIPLKRATKADPTGHLGHSEVLGMFGQGYATACPFKLDIDRILRDARAIVEGTAPVPTIDQEENTVKYWNVPNGPRANIGELSFEPISTETHGAMAGTYADVSLGRLGGGDVAPIEFAVLRQSALNRRGALLADIAAVTTGVDPEILRDLVKAAIDEAIDDDDTDSNTIDPAAIVQEAAAEVGRRIIEGGA